MDAATFETWLGRIAGLNEAQRWRAFEALALSEAGIGTGIERGDPGPVERSWHDGDAVGSPPATPPKPATIADLGRQRLAATGCPHCGQADIARWGTSSGLPRYRCKACARTFNTRTFNALTKTPLARLRMRGKWDQQAKAMIDGVSLTKAADRCGVHRSTAFRWRHRFLAALSDDKPKTLNGIVKSDETFVLESFKSKRSGLPRKSRKQAGPERP